MRQLVSGFIAPRLLQAQWFMKKHQHNGLEQQYLYLNIMTNIDTIFKMNIRGPIALIVVIGGFLTIIYAHVTQTDKNQIYMLMVLVLSFYFGSSQNSAKKDETIANQLNKDVVITGELQKDEVISKQINKK